jgi:hypothetical protein
VLPVSAFYWSGRRILPPSVRPFQELSLPDDFLGSIFGQHVVGQPIIAYPMAPNHQALGAVIFAFDREGLV